MYITGNKINHVSLPFKNRQYGGKIAFMYKKMDKKEKRLSRFNMMKGSYSELDGDQG